jgi:hypothetical protein
VPPVARAGCQDECLITDRAVAASAKYAIAPARNLAFTSTSPPDPAAPRAVRQRGGIKLSNRFASAVIVRLGLTPRLTGIAEGSTTYTLG